MIFKSLPISLNASAPLVRDRDTYAENLTDQLLTYSHVINAFGGYWSAQFTLAGERMATVEDWFDRGLERHIELYSEGGKTWEGFVNRITVSIGALQAVRGPLVDIGNKVDLVYSTVDTSTNPPTIGARKRVGEVDDTDSQTRWGIIQKILSTGGATEATAEQMRDTWILENAEPATTQQVNFQGQGQVTITVECLGYVHWLDLYVYNQTTNTGTIAASTKMLDVLSSTNNPNNSWLPLGLTHVDTNSVVVKRWENDDKTALELCKSMAALGGSSNERWLFGMYNDLSIWYYAAPTDTAYQYRLGDEQQWVTTMVGDWVPPWTVRPGKWIEIPDFLVGRAIGGAYREDPRKLFIESVTYTAPYQVALQGGKTDTLSQMLAKLGLSGVGA